MLRTKLHADPEGLFLHDAILQSCNRFASRPALVDTSYPEPRRISYGEYGELVERAARNLVRIGVKPGEVIAIYLPNSWEYAVTYHAATLAGAIPTLVNPSYRERELRYQLENSGAVMLITNAPLIADANLAGLTNLRGIFTTRQQVAGTQDFARLLAPTNSALPAPQGSPNETMAALPFSSGTTGLPKGVMLSHYNLVANAYQLQVPGEEATGRPDDTVLNFLPLYHIYGLNAVLNPALLMGSTVVLMPRFDLQRSLNLIVSEDISFYPAVPPVLNAIVNAAEKGLFPKKHRVRSCKSGAAPLAPELPKRFTQLTGIRVRQGYGMTEASPVTHLGFLEPEFYAPESIGPPVARTDCRLVDEEGNDVPEGQPGELIMRGPQIMLGYWKCPEATQEVLRDGWYWSGDIARRDERNFYQIVDRRKEMIKYKGFPIAPAEVEAVLLEHPAVRDCGVVGKPDAASGEMPVAFVVLKPGITETARLEEDICGHVGSALSSFKQPREVRFVAAIPRNPSGKILRKELRSQL